MSELDIRAARERVDNVEKRITALAEAGVDVAALRTQLAFAHGALRESRLADIEAICDEVLNSARRLAEIGGRSPPHPAQTRTPAHGTEALQRVKIQRAHLAEEVRSAIDAEVKSQMGANEVVAATQQVDAVARRLAALEARPPAVDLAPLAGQIDQLGRRVAELAASSGEARLLSERLQSLEVRLATSETRPESAGTDPQLLDRLSAIHTRLQAIESRPVPEPKPASPDPQLDSRLAALEALAVREVPVAPDATAIQGIVSQAIADALPRQASELLRAAIEKLPTRDDLHHIAETLRTDLDWRLERAAAEHGWCSLSDVQSTVRRAISEQDPAAGGPAPSQLARLETTLADFVQQSREQQDRLISALADRVAQHTKTLTKRMLVRDGTPTGASNPGSDTEELPPSSSAPGAESGRGSSRMAAITGAVPRTAPGKAPTEFALDAVPAEALEKARELQGHTTLLTKRIVADATPEAAESEPTLHDLVTAAVENALGDAPRSVASTLAPSPNPAPGGGDISSGHRPTTAPASHETTHLPAPASISADFDGLVAAEVARQITRAPSAVAPPTEADLVRAIVRALPVALQDEGVRCELFAILALEATAKPGVLGELTGLRRFLKRELQAVADQVARQENASVP